MSGPQRGFGVIKTSPELFVDEAFLMIFVFFFDGHKSGETVSKARLKLRLLKVDL